jgi:hypothetical protein
MVPRGVLKVKPPLAFNESDADLLSIPAILGEEGVHSLWDPQRTLLRSSGDPT